MGNRVIVLLLIASMALNGYLWVSAQPVEYSEVRQMKEEIESLQQINDALRTQIRDNDQSLQSCTAQLDFYRERIYQLESDSGTCPTGIQGAATLQAPAVIQQIEVVGEGPFYRRVVTEEGTMIDVSVEIIPGKGRVLVQTEPLMGVVFQDAANTAAFVSHDITNTSPASSDTIFSIKADQEIPGVDGPSAGALMTLIMIAAIEGETLDPEVTVTGTIDDDGNIGSIGGLVEKAQAAKDAGKKLLLVPEVNQMISIDDTSEQRIGDIVISSENSETVDTESYIEEEVGIDVEYVGTIEDVLDYAFIREG
ncbi:S16 family serine protease [Methanolobus halotolerans]|uniref:Peptidase S16 n=1 Tax=Methanolobus halotolerans TaxID=2052935 RepID=A0A4E0QZR1_9EURY|nr:S16 family serine protease [Methanolobus halotolerans]TGC09399.1 peptidase S16 [Methanolobus halotolerans]